MVFLGLSMERAFESVAIAHFFPRVAQEDFKPMARAVRLHMLTAHNVGTLDIQPCLFGDAFVGFNSQLERRRFLDGPPLCFDGYSVSFVKHDEGDNALTYDMDREVWLLLLGYPLDARATLAIAKYVASLAMLRHVHDSDVLSRVIIKVSMSSETMVPPSITVGAGDGPKIRTWTVPVYILSASSIPEMGDEDSFLPADGLHPLPPLAPRWMGLARDHPFHGESFVEENRTPAHVGLAGQQVAGSGAQLPQAQNENDGSPLSPGAMDFAASGGVHLDSPKGAASPAVAAQQAVLFPAPPPVVDQHKTEVIPISPYHGAALSLFNRIHPAALSLLDLNLDLALLLYLSLSTVIDTIKLIKDD
jgi:hypothetical protein